MPSAGGMLGRQFPAEVLFRRFWSCCWSQPGLAPQNKVSGTAQCAKPDPRYAIEVGDQPNHSFIIFHGGCTWTSPLEIAGEKSKDHSGTVFQEASGNRANSRGSGVDTMENGDKFYIAWRGSARIKEGMLSAEEGTWSLTGGNGKLKGMRCLNPWVAKWLGQPIGVVHTKDSVRIESAGIRRHTLTNRHVRRRPPEGTRTPTPSSESILSTCVRR